MNGKRVEGTFRIRRLIVLMNCIVPIRKVNPRYDVVASSLTFQIINGSPVSTINPATLRNPECLSEYVAIGKELRAEVGM